MDINLIGRRIRECREAKGVSAEELASEIGVHKATIHRYENGDFKSVKLPVIDSIAVYLGVSPAYLIGKTDNPAPEITPLNTRDKKDVTRIIEETKALLSQEGLMFDGEPADEESVKSIIDAMTIGLEIAKRRNKKYTPKRYKKE